MASSNDAVAREDILRIAANRAAEKYAKQFARFTYIGDGDSKAARELGWQFIGIGTVEQANRLRQTGVEIVVQDYRPTGAFLRLLCDCGAARTL